MQYFVSKQFEKQFRKLPKKVRLHAIRQFELFLQNHADYRLGNHPLAGTWAGHRSIDITGDVRAVYEQVEGHTARFVAIGSHSELYE